MEIIKRILLVLMVTLFMIGCKKDVIEPIEETVVDTLETTEDAFLNKWNDIAKVVSDPTYCDKFRDGVYNHYGLELQSNGKFK